MMSIQCELCMITIDEYTDSEELKVSSKRTDMEDIIGV